MKYQVVVGSVKDSADFAKKVQDQLAEGWHLQGGVCTEGGVLAQALMRASTLGDYERPEFKRETVYIK